MNTALSGVAMNQTMAHTVRPNEARGCEMCHSLVDEQNRTRNEHVMAYSYGVGTGSIAYLSDFVYATGLNGLELFEYKQEKELNNHNAGTSNRFPGLVVNPTVADRKAANVEPIVTGTATDVVLIRNFNATPGIVGQTQSPSIRDFAVIGLNNAGLGSLVITDVSARAHPSAARPALNNTNFVRSVNLPQPPRALAHLQNDVSDPFIYVAAGTAGVCVVEMQDATLLAGAFSAANPVCTAITGTANEITINGDILVVGTVEGNVDVFQISTSNATQITRLGGIAVGGGQVNEIAFGGFAMFVATQQGLAILELTDPSAPARPAGAPQFVAGTAPALSVAVGEGHAYVATGTNVLDVDARTIANPKAPVSIVPGGQTANAVDVVISQMPGQRWVIALESGGDLVGIKLDNTESKLERCFPNPAAADCLLEIDMFDATRSGRDPSFNPLNGTFDAADPSGQPFFRMQGAILGSGTRMVRPTLFEQIGFLSGRRYRDSFMPGSGVLSLPVMQSMRSVQVCELGPGNSTNPSGIGELGYAIDGSCEPFASAQKPRRLCTSRLLAPGLRSVVCNPVKSRLKTAEPTKPLFPDPAPSLRPTRSAMIPTRD
jgi:hypothetical protein